MKNLTYTPHSYQRVAKELKGGLTQHLDVILGQVKNIVKNDKIKDVPSFKENFEKLKDLETYQYLDFYDNFTYFNFYSLVNSKDFYRLNINEISSLLLLGLKLQPQLILFKEDFNKKFKENDIGSERKVKGLTTFQNLTLEQLSVNATSECLEYWMFQNNEEKNVVFDKMLFSFADSIYYIRETPEYKTNTDYRKTINQKSLAYNADSLLFMDSSDISLVAFDDVFLSGIKHIQEQKIKVERDSLAKKGQKAPGKLELRLNKDFKILEDFKSNKLQLNEILNAKLNVDKVVSLDNDINNYLLENDMITSSDIAPQVPVVEVKKPEKTHDTPDVQVIRNNVDLSSVYGNVTQKTEKPKTKQDLKNEDNDDFELS